MRAGKTLKHRERQYGNDARRLLPIIIRVSARVPPATALSSSRLFAVRVHYRNINVSRPKMDVRVRALTILKTLKLTPIICDVWINNVTRHIHLR